MSKITAAVIDLPALMARCHAGAKAKGFWDETTNQGQQLMLVISELSEALEADRKGRVGDLKRYVADTAELAKNPQYAAFQPATFQELVKDSVGDELADAYIRLCDFAVGFGVATPNWISDYVETIRRRRAYSQLLPENFGEALLSITRVVVEAYGDFAPINLCIALVRLQELAERMNIDLFRHIDLKLTYNASRPAKHGKAY